MGSKLNRIDLGVKALFVGAMGTNFLTYFGPAFVQSTDTYSTAFNGAAAVLSVGMIGMSAWGLHDAITGKNINTPPPQLPPQTWGRGPQQPSA